MTPFGKRIREHRNVRGITLKQMAADLGVSSAYFSALEHGHRGLPQFGVGCANLWLFWIDVG